MQPKNEAIRIFVGGPHDANEEGQKVIEMLRNKTQTELGRHFSIVANNWKDEHNRFALKIDDQQESINERFDVREADIVLMLFRGSLGGAEAPGSDAPSASAWELQQAAEAGRARAIGIFCLHFANAEPPNPGAGATKESRESYQTAYATWSKKADRFDELKAYLTSFCDKWRGCGRNIHFTDDLGHGLNDAVDDFVRSILKLPVEEPDRRLKPKLNFVGAPYCGLYEYNFKQRDAYFGRAAEIKELFEKCRGANAPRLLLVHGASGVGKSSLVQAGLLKALLPPDDPDFKLKFMVFEPAGESRRPFRELAGEIKRLDEDSIRADKEELSDQLRRIFAGLPADESAESQRAEAARKFEREICAWIEKSTQQEFLPIIINQLEKIYDVAEEERAPFFNFLACAPHFEKFRLIGSIRQDAYDRLVQQEQHVNAALGEGEHGNYTLRPPAQRQLREMIVEPWRLMYGEPKAEFQDFVDAILGDALNAREAELPLVSLTLFVLHNQHKENITLAAYEALGRLKGVVSKVAEEQQADLQQLKLLFKPLSFLQNGRWSTRGARKEALIAAGVDAPLIEKLAGNKVRFLHIGVDTGGKPSVQLAHEVLFTAWPALIKYTEEAYLLESERAAVIDDARKWRDSGRRPLDLKLRGEAYRKIDARRESEPGLFDGPDREVTEQYLSEARKFELRERLVAAVNSGLLGELVDIVRQGGALEYEDRGPELGQLRPQFWAAVTGNDYETPDVREWKTQQCPAPPKDSLFIKKRTLALSCATRGLSVAHIAAACGRLDLLRRLFELNPSVGELKTEGSSNLVVAAVVGGNLQTVKYLVEDRKLPFDDEDDDKSRPIIWAVQKKHAEVSALLQKHGARLEVMTEDGFTNLTEAARSGDVDAVRAALDIGFNVDGQTADGQTALMIAASAGRKEVVRFLLERKASPSLTTRHGLTALHTVAWQKVEAPEIIELLIAGGADRNARDDDGSTPLHWAAIFGKVLLVKALLGQDVERDPLNGAGFRPLLGAAAGGQAEAVRELLRGGADVGKPGQSGWTALHFAADDGDQTTLHELLLHPPTREIIDRRSQDGWTALMLAARKGHATVVRRLIEHGADCQLALRDGRDALALAIKSLSAQTVREILAPGPRVFLQASASKA